MAFRFANQCPIVKCDIKPIGKDSCWEVFRFSWTDWGQIFDKLRFFWLYLLLHFWCTASTISFQCQIHKRLLLFGFSVFSTYLLFWETYRLFCMYAGVKSSLHYVYAQTYLDSLHIHCSHLTSPVVLLLPLSGSSFSTNYSFFAARFIISQRASVCEFTLQIIPLFIIYFPPCTFLLANAMFLVSVPHHFFLSAFSQLLSCFLPHRCFHMAVVPEVAYSVGDYAFVQIWASIGVCLNEF